MRELPNFCLRQRRALAARRERYAGPARRLSRAPPPRRRAANSRRRAVPAASRAGKVEDARHAGPPHKVHCLEPGVVFVSYEGNPDITPIAEHDA